MTNPDSLDRSEIVVLLVDDDPLVGEIVRRALGGESNVDLHYCGNPFDAERTAEQIRPTVILQDLVMPGAEGLTLVRQYRANAVTRDIPIIVLSAREEATVKSDAFAAGANDYLVKVPDKIELIARIRYHSVAYLTRLQRDEAYRALRESQQLLLEKNVELERLTKIDRLTGLSNRAHFNELIGADWRRAIRERRPVSILMIDVDDFKSYNDTYGHLAGDDLLKKIADAIRSCSQRSTDIAARFAGDEFIVGLSVGQDGARRVCEKLQQAVKALEIPHKAATHGSIVTLSIGVASTTPHPGDSYLGLIKAADDALYEAKRSGKNRLAVGT